MKLFLMRFYYPAGDALQNNEKNIYFIYTIFAVPPKSPVIVNEAGREATSQLGPYNEGSTVQISCEVSEGKFNASSLIYVCVVKLDIVYSSI